MASGPWFPQNCGQSLLCKLPALGRTLVGPGSPGLETWQALEAGKGLTLEDGGQGSAALEALLTGLGPEHFATTGETDLEFPAQLAACAKAIMQVCPSLPAGHQAAWDIVVTAVGLFKAAEAWQKLQPLSQAGGAGGGTKAADAAAAQLQEAQAAFMQAQAAGKDTVTADLSATLLEHFAQAAARAETDLRDHHQSILDQTTAALKQAIADLRLVAFGMADGTSWKDGVPNEPDEETWNVLQGKLQEAPIVQKAHAKNVGARHTTVVKAAPRPAPHRRLPSLTVVSGLVAALSSLRQAGVRARIGCVAPSHRQARHSYQAQVAKAGGKEDKDLLQEAETLLQ